MGTLLPFADKLLALKVAILKAFNLDQAGYCFLLS